MKRFTTLFLCVYATLASFNLAAQQAVKGFYAIKNLASLSIAINTADKPQSKVWSYDGKHWAVLANEAGTHVWRLDGTSWTKVLTIASSTSPRADCKVVDNVVHILLFRGSSADSYLLSLEYVPGLQTYKLWSRRPEKIDLPLQEGVETATMDIDGTGRMWIAHDGKHDVYVQWSDPPYKTWSAPITIATGITDDDISGIIAMPDKIGVLWSNQNTKRFGFKTHANGAAPTAWSADEVPASQSALDVGKGMADDHLNMAVASDGTLYCAVKTSYDEPGYPKLALLVRRPQGTWDDLYRITSTEGTRPIVLLNETFGKMKVVYTSAERGGRLVYRESALSKIAFSPPFTLINGFHNYATSSKDNFSTDVVILATNMNPIAQGNTWEAVGVLATDVEGVTVYSESEEGELLAYPNPLQTQTTITFAVQESGDYTLDLYDSKGIFVSSLEQGIAEAGEVYSTKLNTYLKGGLYFVRLQTENRTKTLKLVIQN
ncbi:T9SS type A sorting domain-containing protein [Botryobacter ruber]|uniref:T9SS type A sorting domain-containing protein n=1 Tax=Botryobacter ruber TaxID=2171629 RepID=UPI000F646960|nr:T9SS type A sorting domain-containing protein [Botryobacter ruber]